MRVLIVEDNEFNAFCLRRLLESVLTGTDLVTVVNNSHSALSLTYNNPPDLVIIDGNLGAAGNGWLCNGPELANILLYKYPQLPLIAWSTSEVMRRAFIEIFEHHDRSINEYSFWDKMVSIDCISSTWAHYFGAFVLDPKVRSSSLRGMPLYS